MKFLKNYTNSFMPNMGKKSLALGGGGLNVSNW